MERIFVIGANERHATEWAMKNHLDRRNINIITNAYQLRGVSDRLVIFLAGWERNPEAVIAKHKIDTILNQYGVRYILLADDSELARYEAFHPRAMKLIKKGKPFIVVAEDEHYFLEVYKMIRTHEKLIDRWTEHDEVEFQDAVALKDASKGKIDGRADYHFSQHLIGYKGE